VHLRTPTRMAGFLQLERARVRWFLSIEIDDVPADLRAQGQRTYRSLTVNGKNMEVDPSVTLAELIAHLGWEHHVGAVAVNLTFVSADAYALKHLTEGDTVEILAPVYGG